MLVHIYILILVVAFIATALGITPPRRRAEVVQPLGALTGALLFALVGVSSLNVEVPDGAGGTLVFDSLYLVILWMGFALMNLIGAVYGVFDEAFEDTETSERMSQGQQRPSQSVSKHFDEL